MLTPTQRQALLALFCLITLLCVGVEAYAVAVILSSQADFGSKTVATLLNGTVLGGVGLVFVRLIEKTFLRASITPIDALAGLAAERSRLADQGLQPDEFLARRELVTATLAFAEQCIRPWLDGTHFELSVFVDPDQPLLFAYYDTGPSRTARSMKDREEGS